MAHAASRDGADADKHDQVGIDDRPLFGRVPTSLVVTVLGVALTAWLLPAFTRQWDDRQKAQELKASIASQIAAATADALVLSKKEQRRAAAFNRASLRSNTASTLAFRRSESVASRLDDAWLLNSIKIEAKLRAYFVPALVA